MIKNWFVLFFIFFGAVFLFNNVLAEQTFIDKCPESDRVSCNLVIQGESTKPLSVAEGICIDTKCEINYCGDGKKGGKEECDDGNNVDGDGCSANCTHEFCGDKVITTTNPNSYYKYPGGLIPGWIYLDNLPETCDLGTGFNKDNKRCNLVCHKTSCGDGIIQMPNWDNKYEECDRSFLGNGWNSNCTDKCNFDCNYYNDNINFKKLQSVEGPTINATKSQKDYDYLQCLGMQGNYVSPDMAKSMYDALVAEHTPVGLVCPQEFCSPTELKVVDKSRVIKNYKLSLDILNNPGFYPVPRTVQVGSCCALKNKDGIKVVNGTVAHSETHWKGTPEQFRAMVNDPDYCPGIGCSMNWKVDQINQAGDYTEVWGLKIICENVEDVNLEITQKSLGVGFDWSCQHKDKRVIALQWWMSGEIELQDLFDILKSG